MERGLRRDRDFEARALAEGWFRAFLRGLWQGESYVWDLDVLSQF